MDRKFVAVTAIAVVALIVAVAAISFSFSMIQIKQRVSTPSVAPTLPSPSPKATQNSVPSQTPQPTGTILTYGIINWNRDGSSMTLESEKASISLQSGSHHFAIRVVNQSPNQSPKPCFISLRVSSLDGNSLSPADVYLGINTQGHDPLYGVPDVMYSHYTEISATANGNILTYLFAPAGGYWSPYIEYLSPSGFSIPAGFDEDFSMKPDLNAVGNYQIAVGVVPAG